MDLFLTLVLILCGLLGLYYLRIKTKYSYWSDRGVPGPRPSFFGMGNLFAVFGDRPEVAEVRLWQQYGPVYGVYLGFDPVLTIADVDLIQQVMVKDFGHFINRQELKTYHKLFNHNLFFAEDDEWKRIRSIASPSFTSGKLRSMAPLMNRCIEKLVTYFNSVAENGSGVIKTKEVLAGFTIDNIALTAFATETDANDSRQSLSPFIKNGLEIFDFPLEKMIFAFSFPRWFNNLIGAQHNFRKRNFDFFVQLTQTIVRQRMKAEKEKAEANGTTGQQSKRNDLVQLLIDGYITEGDLQQMNKNLDKLSAEIEDSIGKTTNGNHSISSGVKRHLTEDEIVAQCIFFFFAGFETTAGTLTTLIFELVSNPKIQEKTYQELVEVLGTLDPSSEQYYEAVMTRLPYLEAVIKETLRKYPPVVRLDRRCATEGYKLGGITLSKGTLVHVPSFAVHRNPAYYPEPEVFKPERFLAENKHLLVPHTYIPFGIGSRNCIGMRFAYQVLRLMLATILRQFKFTATEGTPDKLQFRSMKPLLNVEPFPVAVERRS
ncbi:hypothetical protein TYRP_021294 [Tyrophagus putrescentiae]|nr:hypothetical protein TYRP_021294 [Tyrophagus putrescentiae]